MNDVYEVEKIGPGMRLVRDKERDCPLELKDDCAVEFVRIESVESMSVALIDELSEMINELGKTLQKEENGKFLEKAADVLEAYIELLKQRGLAFGDAEVCRRELKEKKGGFKGVLRIVNKIREQED